jgi:hypothetical protein
MEEVRKMGRDLEKEERDMKKFAHRLFVIGLILTPLLPIGHFLQDWEPSTATVCGGLGLFGLSLWLGQGIGRLIHPRLRVGFGLAANALMFVVIAGLITKFLGAETTARWIYIAAGFNFCGFALGGALLAVEEFSPGIHDRMA